MTAVARMAVLPMRTVAPYRNQGLAVFALVTALLANNPSRIVPALVLLVTSTVAAYPFAVADKAGLDTLYAVLPLPRRSVLLGHYLWALASFAATVVLGTTLAAIFAGVENQALSAHTIVEMVSLAWGLFAVNIAIQFPILIRWGYTRMGLWATSVPLALVMITVVKSHIVFSSVERWLPLLWPLGIALLAASAATATATDRRR